VHQVACTSHLRTRSRCEGVAPPGSQAGHAEPLGISHGFPEKRLPLPYVAVSGPTQIRQRQLSAGLNGRGSVPEAFIRCYCSSQVLYGEVELATGQGRNTQGAMGRSKADNGK
jgi:hypothetical protein